MEYRVLGNSGWKVSATGLGAWAIGGQEWGPVDDRESAAALRRAIDLGVNLIDTADAYGNGHSERLIGALLKERSERIYVATKLGRLAPVHGGDPFSLKSMTAWVDGSRQRLGTDALDLVQLHTPPSAVFERQEVFESLGELQRTGKIRHWGASVETVAEGLRVLDYPGVAAVQIIFNLFRHKPAEEFLPRARSRGVGVLARVPLASGLLTGKMTAQTRFQPDDHRTLLYGGETFAGVAFERGLRAVEELKPIVPAGMTLAQLAIRWILMHEGVTCAIPGAKRPSQVEENAAAADLPPLDEATMRAVRQIYDRHLRAHVHHLY